MRYLKERLSTVKGRIGFIFWLLYWAAVLVFILLFAQPVIEDKSLLPVPGYVYLLALIAAVVICAVISIRRFILKGVKKPAKESRKAGSQEVIVESILVEDENSEENPAAAAAENDLPSKKAKKKKEPKPRMKPWHIPLLALDAFLCFFVLEYPNNPVLWEMSWFYVLINIAGIGIMLTLWLVFLNSVRRAVIANTAFFTVMSYVFYMVYLFRGEPFQFIDIFSFATAAEVAGAYSFVMTRALVAVTVAVLCVIGVIFQFRDYRLFKSIPGRIISRGAAVAFMVAAYFFYLNVNWNGGLGILTDLFAPIKTYKEYGTQVGFFCVAKYMQLTPPEGYSLDEARAIAESVEVPEEGNTGYTAPVNILCIMNESWGDLRLIGEVNSTEEIMPYYDSMTSNVIKGHSLVCIKGGGTAKTEYEFLTGNSVKRFPAMVPYVSYFTHDQYSLVTTLKDQGYYTIAMHPYIGSNWNRYSAYEKLQFDTFMTIDDFDPNADKLHGHITDKANYDKIIEVVEESEDPVFLFDITMQNHGGYSANDTAQKVRITDYHGEGADALNRYVTLLKASDDALQYLIEYFEKSDEPTIILMFGDHFPTLADAYWEQLSGDVYDNLSIEEQQMYYNTPFVIWANYPISEELDVQTSVNFLGTLVMQQTNLEMPAYNWFLADMYKTMPALNHLGYMDSEGNFYRWADAEDEAAVKEWDYECLQYNNLAETSKRLDWFFTIEK